MRMESRYSFKVTGDMTIKTTTKPVTWDVTTQLSGDTLTGTATTEILMSTFNVGPISILGMLNTEDKVKLTFEFVAKPVITDILNHMRVVLCTTLM